MKHPKSKLNEWHHGYLGILLQLPLLFYAGIYWYYPLIFIVLTLIIFAASHYTDQIKIPFLIMGILACVGTQMPLHTGNVSLIAHILSFAGCAIYLDDLGQHIVQWRYPKYYSPMHRLGMDLFYRVKSDE